MRRRTAGLALLLAGALLAACASPPPPASRPAPQPGKAIVHVVRAGETLWSISQRYGTTVSAVARLNRLEDPTQIRAGQRLYIPGNGRNHQPSKDPVVWRRSDPRGTRGTVDLMWPVRGRISSRFGMRNGAHHDGIDIPAKAGTPVRAAEAGRVIHSGNSLAGYGNLVIIKHAGNLSTVYAHNRRNLVKVGDFVERGQEIAEVGKTGRATANHVHFEVRRNGSPRNPLDYLP